MAIRRVKISTIGGQSVALRATQSHSEAIRGHQCGTQRHSKALRATQRHSDAITGTQTQSEEITSTQQHSAALSGHRDPRRPRGPRLPAPSLVARAARARARLMRHRCAHLPVTFAADVPRSAALVLRVPALQHGKTPAGLAAEHNDNAAVKAFFASGQVRPIRVQSEGTQRLRGGHRGHSVAI
jgi:hypothetical protein